MDKLFNIKIGSKWLTTGNMYTYCKTTASYSLLAGGKYIEVLDRGNSFGMPCWIVEFEFNNKIFSIPSDQFFALTKLIEVEE